LRNLDFTGMRFGSVTILNRFDTDKWGRQLWMVKCDCGREKPALEVVFKDKNYKSCGCYARKAAGDRKRTHGMSKTKTFHAWQNMLDRCENKNSVSYPGYGERGIAVCDEWHNFINFYNDMGEKPKGKSIERINNEKGYCKENCKWATAKEQMNNTRYSKILTLNGISLTISLWSERLGINRSTLYNRSLRKWTDERTLTLPAGKRKMKGM